MFSKLKSCQWYSESDADSIGCMGTLILVFSAAWASDSSRCKLMVISGFLLHVNENKGANVFTVRTSRGNNVTRYFLIWPFHRTQYTVNQSVASRLFQCTQQNGKLSRRVAKKCARAWGNFAVRKFMTHPALAKRIS